MPALDFITYDRSYDTDFFRINKEWIEDLFTVEETDLKVMRNPYESIIKDGGQILYANYNDKIAGTCALRKIAEGEYELTKMAVDKKFRGLGIGKKLCTATIELARSLHAKRIVLYSNIPGSNTAIAIYRQLGFIEIPLTEQAYGRANIKMEMRFLD